MSHSPRTAVSALIPAGLVRKKMTYQANGMSWVRVRYYANYVTGFHFKAILSPSMYAASCDNEQVIRPPFVRFRLAANHST
ncbi:hypothetical protein HJ199_24485 [Vibrio parahaemolyticus]|nr:hypothetical protein [Vibrio parahaemolyticus]